MRVVLNRLCAGTAPHLRGCRLSFLREGTVTIWRRHINARKCQWSDAPQARFKTHAEETEGREEEGGLPELHQWVLGDSVVSKAVKAGWAGFPSCRLNLRLEPRSWTSASTQTDQFCRTKKKNPPCSTAGSFSRRDNPHGLAAGQRKGNFSLSPLHWELSPGPPGGSTRPVPGVRVLNCVEMCG